MILFGIRNLKAGHSTRIQLGKNSKTRTASTGYGICTTEMNGCIVMLLLVFTGTRFQNLRNCASSKAPPSLVKRSIPPPMLFSFQKYYTFFNPDNTFPLNTPRLFYSFSDQVTPAEAKTVPICFVALGSMTRSEDQFLQKMEY